MDFDSIVASGRGNSGTWNYALIAKSVDIALKNGYAIIPFSEIAKYYTGASYEGVTGRKNQALANAVNSVIGKQKVEAFARTKQHNKVMSVLIIAKNITEEQKVKFVADFSKFTTPK